MSESIRARKAARDAKVAEITNKHEASEHPVQKKRLSRRVILVSIVILLISISASFFFLGKKLSHSAGDEANHENTPTLPQVFYYTFGSAFVAEIKDDPTQHHYLQTTITVSFGNEKISKLLKAYEPSIKAKILELMANYTYAELLTLEGKEKLRQQILEVIQAAISEKEKSATVDQVLFVDYVME